jgi:Holliday junction DNA helicase RuvA
MLAYVRFFLYLCAQFCIIMIEYIKGQLTDINPTYVVLEAAGVGYAINIALPTYSSLVGKEGQESKLYITEIIREDAHELYGFFSRGERELFVMLMTVSGIGANTARMIMSAYSAAEVRQIIATGNARALSQVKGLGPKTAQRIIVDLKDKVLKIDLGDEAKGERLEAIGLLGEEVKGEDSAVKQEAVSALVMLGFAAAASGKAVDKILKAVPESSVEQVIKQALKML